MCCCEIVTLVFHKTSLLSFSGPRVSDNFSQLSRTMRPSESQRIIPTVSTKSQTPSSFLTPPPPPTSPSLPFVQPVITFVTLLRQVRLLGLPVALRRVSDLWPDKWNLKLPPGEGAGSAALHRAVPLSCIVWPVFCFYTHTHSGWKPFHPTSCCFILKSV